MLTIDLHIHSRYSSDGELAPGKIVEMAGAAGIDYISITDHNKTLGVDEAIAASGASGPRIIPGIEIDCQYMGLEIHLLGYFIDHSDKRYRDLWNDIESQERAKADLRIDLVNRLGIKVDHDTVIAKSRNGVVASELIAEVALGDPDNRDNPKLLPYRPGGSRDDNPYVNFYWDYCAPGKPAFVEISIMDLASAVGLVKDTGGVPVIAHPGKTLKGEEQRLPGILAHGVMGIEAYCSYHSPEQCRFWRQRADEASVLYTCGSDFHGKTKPAIRLGEHGGAAYAEEVIENLTRALTAGAES